MRSGDAELESRERGVVGGHGPGWWGLGGGTGGGGVKENRSSAVATKWNQILGLAGWFSVRPGT